MILFNQKSAEGRIKPAVARIESWKNISLKTLQRYASTIGREVRLNIVPL